MVKGDMQEERSGRGVVKGKDRYMWMWNEAEGRERGREEERDKK